MRELEQEVRELKRANEILKRAASFFGAVPGRQHRNEFDSSTRIGNDVVADRRHGLERICRVLQVAPPTYCAANGMSV